MKLLFISNIGGKRISAFSRSSIEATKNLGIEFDIAANWNKSNDEIMLEEEKRHCIKMRHIDIDRNPFSLQNIKAYKQMLRLIKREKYDVIHCNTPIGGILGRLCGKAAGVPKIIYTSHGFHFYRGAPLVNRTLFKWAEIVMARYTDALITINKEDYKAAKSFKLKPQGKSYYIPGVGIETESLKKNSGNREELLSEIGIAKDSILLISVGELNSNKNNEIIIDALKELNNPKIHYLICGVGNKREDLQKRVKAYNLQKNVHFLGHRDDIPKLLISSDIFLLPSYREGLSRSLMEAMSLGLPCIVSNIRGNVDLIEDRKGGFLCDANNISHFKDAIEKLVESKQHRTDMGQYNLTKIDNFDSKNVINLLQKIYAEVIFR